MEGADKSGYQQRSICAAICGISTRLASRMMERYDCNAFTTPCKELCASRLPQKNKCVPCITHSLNKDDRIPSACEEDLAVWMAMMMMMYLTRQSVFMGNPVLVLAGSRTWNSWECPSF